MNTALKSFFIVFFVSFLITIIGVVVFFKPIASSEELRLSLPPIIALVYVLFCVLIYIWAFKEIKSSYKAGLVVAMPQIVLIIDLVLRGDRGPMTGLSGSFLLIVTWAITAFVHDKYMQRAV